MESSRSVLAVAPVDGQTRGVLECVRRELLAAGPSALSPDESLAIVTGALDMLEAVGHLLDALSPAEVQATAERAHLGRLSDAHAGYWRVFSARHRVLADVFATQRSTFADKVRAYVERRAANGADARKGRP
jgi:hypothetical protein